MTINKFHNNIFLLIGFLFLFTSLLPYVLVREPVNSGHIFSSHLMFEFFTKNNFGFGINFIDNVGPYGYLHYPMAYTGLSFWDKILWNVGVVLFYSMFASLFVAKISPLYQKVVALVVLSYFPFQVNFPFFAYEILPRLAILFSIEYCLDAPISISRRNGLIFYGVPICYAAITLEKASNLFVIIFLMIIFTVYVCSNKDYIKGLVFLGIYLVSVFLLWILVGQNASEILRYVASSFEFQNAYQDALRTTEGYPNLIFGLLTFGLASITILLRINYSRRFSSYFRHELVSCIILLVILFISWKHGILRSSGAYGIYINILPCIFIFICYYPIGGRFNFYNSYFQNTIFITAILIVILNYYVTPGNIYRSTPYSKSPLSVIDEYAQRYELLYKYNLFGKKQELERALEYNTKAVKLPRDIRDIIQGSKVDEFGDTGGDLILNKLNYKPRPIPIYFIAVTNKLKQYNYDYYVDIARRPEFVFVSNNTIYRPKNYFQSKDSMAFASILLNYFPIDSFKHWLILKVRNNMANVNKIFCSKREVTINQYIDVPNIDGAITWAEIDIRLSLLGKIVRIFYKPFNIKFEYICNDNIVRETEVVPVAISSGAILTPIIDSNEDLIKYFNNDRNNKPNIMIKFKIKYFYEFCKYLFVENIIVKFYHIYPQSSMPSPSE